MSTATTITVIERLENLRPQTTTSRLTATDLRELVNLVELLEAQPSM